MRCESCGANHPPLATECPYCKVTTAAGHAAAAQRVAWEQQRAAQAAHAAAQAAHAQHQAQMQREWHLRARAARLPLWGLFALFVPCLGVPALIAALVAWGVRGEAKRSNLPVPGQVTTALVMSALGGILSIFVLVWFSIDSAEHEARVEALEKQARPLVDRPVLTQPEACIIAEWHVERDGHDGTSGLSIKDFRCDGRLLATRPDELLLESLAFKAVSKPVEVDVCFARKARWTVERVVPAGAGCDAPLKDAGSAAASAASAAPSGSSPSTTGPRGPGRR